jgi:FkbH-like protein
MKLSEALGILKDAREKARVHRVVLVCGFTPLHLKTFLAAHLQSAMADARIEIVTGVYGDIAGALSEVPAGSELVVVLEWPDLDPRLGFRRLGGWGPESTADIAASVRARLAFLAGRLSVVAESSSATLCLPSTPLPPFACAPGWLLNADTLTLRGELNEFALDLLRRSSVRVLESNLMPPTGGAESFDFKSELQSGFPYTLSHASRLAATISRALVRQQPKKGLITDLDDTLWSGLLGEVGIEGVAWTLEREAQVHGIYQQLLNGLAGAGTLLAVASKNDPGLVKEALARLDLAIDKKYLYPIEVSWGAKSEAVRKILACWNIGASDVVFIDDSPMELAEVKSAFPDMECILFNSADYGYSHELFFRLQDLFGKLRISAEDRLRLSSIKGQERLRDERGQAKSDDEFLQELGATLTVRFSRDFAESRPLELVNKTNQFNLNGIRFDPAGWKQLSNDPERYLVLVDYKDKFGPLGVIAVATGVRSDGALKVDAWVMSCRAFSRRIEYGMLAAMFANLAVDRVEFQFSPTERNAPMQEYLGKVVGPNAESGMRVSKADFHQACPPLHHTVIVHTDCLLEAE